jgi:type I restriction enzyme S subunit
MHTTTIEERAMSNNVPAGYKQTEVGVIPEDWDVTLLDKIANRGSGHTPSKSHPEYWNGTIKWISLQDSNRLDRVYIQDTAAKITLAGIANSSAVMHPAGTVVLILQRDFIHAGSGAPAAVCDVIDTPDDSQFASTPRFPAPTLHQMCGAG